MGNIHNIRVVRFLLVVSIVVLTIFIYASYSSNATLTPPSPHALHAASITEHAGGANAQLQQLAAANLSKFNDAALSFGNGIDNSGFAAASNHFETPQGGSTLLKMNKKAAVMAGTATGTGSAKAPVANTAKKQHQHQHREPTIDVDDVNDEAPDDDEMERFGNELLEDTELQNIDNALVAGSINYPNTTGTNNVGAALEQSKAQPQAQLDKQKQTNEKPSDTGSNLNKILDSDVMIPTSNLQKFIENADKILKNITASPTANEKLSTKESKGSEKLPEKSANIKTPKGEDKDKDDVNDEAADDGALPPSVVMTIKQPGSGNAIQQNTVENRASSKVDTKQTISKVKAIPKVSSNKNHPVQRNNSDHTKGIPTSEIYEPGHLNEEINFAKICPNQGEDIKLLILISSALNHAEARLAIRQTWAHYGTRRDVSIAFILGRTTNETVSKELSIENFIYGDMIRGNFIDSYTNLTLKTISTLEWVDLHCQQAKFILKTDDDMFINVPKLLQFIDNHAKEKRVIYGRLAKQWKPIRNKKSKYYVSTDQFSQPLFPPFTTGPAYLITSDVIHSLYNRCLQQVYLKLEDVFTTGIVAQQLGIKRVHANEFLNRRIAFNPCNIRKLISVHMVKSNEQFDLWKKLLDKSTKCK